VYGSPFLPLLQRSPLLLSSDMSIVALSASRVMKWSISLSDLPRGRSVSCCCEAIFPHFRTANTDDGGRCRSTLFKRFLFWPASRLQPRQITCAATEGLMIVLAGDREVRMACTPNPDGGSQPRWVFLRRREIMCCYRDLTSIVLVLNRAGLRCFAQVPMSCAATEMRTHFCVSHSCCARRQDRDTPLHKTQSTTSTNC